MLKRKGRAASHHSKLRAIKANAAKLLGSLGQYRTMLYCTLLFSAAGSILKVIAPTIIKKLSDRIVMAELDGVAIDMDKIAHYGMILFCLYAASALLGALQSLAAAKLSAAVTQNYRSKINEKINRLPLKYLDNHSVGDTLSRMTNDVDTLGQGLNDSLNNIVTSVTMVLGTVVMMFVNSGFMTLVVLATMPISVAVIVATVKFSQKYFVRQQKELGEINGRVEEVFSCHTVVYSFGGQEREQRRFDQMNAELSNSIAKANFFSSLLHPVMSFMGNLSYIVICIVGGYLAVSRMDIAFVTTIVIFVSYMNIFNNQVGNIANISSVLQANAAANERILEFLNEEEEKPETALPQHRKIMGNIEFQNVSFGYEPGKTILHHLNVRVKAGQKVAIVGPTGAGKTTLVNLLMRFYEVTDGDILIDGVSIKAMPKEEVRSCFGMVLQDTWLFEGTVRENLCFGAKNISDAGIENACKLAYIDRFVSSLPDGYDTVIDEKANISQGQRQLLTIARAVAGKPPMLILDEATSSVDTRTEEQIQKVMDSISRGKTSFVIAHRLSTIKNADVILVLKDGDVIEQGQHEELLAHNDFYAKLYHSQFTAE